MGLRILHSADWHLGSPFRGFDRERQRLLKEAQRKIPDLVADLCRRENCDLVLLAGDLFDAAPSKDWVELLKAALADCAVPVFLAPGNHDFCAPGSPWLEEVWPENVHIFTGGLESVALKELDCRIYGAGYTSMDCEALLEGFRAECEERYQIGLLHGDPVQLHSPYCPVTAAQVRDSGLSYLALGHIHKSGAFRAGQTLCGWPGCPMGRGYDETGEMGLYLVELETDVTIRKLLLRTPRFYEITVNTDAQSPEDVLPGVGSDDFYRLTLTGSGEVDEGVFARFPNLVLRDYREEQQDLWCTAEEDTLEGTYFRILWEALEDADEKDAARIRQAAAISRKILEGREVEL